MKTVNVYLLFNGNCEEAFNFYKSVLGGEFSYVGRYKDMPASEGSKPVNKNDENRIMHVSLPVSKETILMGSDSNPEHGEVKFGTNFSVSFNTDSKEDADKIFKGISESGKVNMPMTDTFWGSYFGMCTDKFGINWMISCQTDKKD